MRKPLKTPLPLSRLLADALQKAASPDPDPLARLQARWTYWLGETLGEKTKPAKILGRKLIVSVSASVWANEFEFRKGAVLAAVRQDCPEISLDEIRYQIETRPSASI